MKAKCISVFPGFYFTLGKVYEFNDNINYLYEGKCNRPYSSTQDDLDRYVAFYIDENTMFEFLKPPEGWNYCKCGTMTTNNLCCDCKDK
jgi:hypothetical protein